MNIIDKLERQSTEAAEIIIFEIEYLSGKTVEDDLYKAFQSDLNIVAYGSTEAQAILSARKEAVGRMMEDSELRTNLVKILEEEQTRSGKVSN